MKPYYRQRGNVLIVSLLMLLVLTGLAVSAVSMTSLNLRMVGNMQDQFRAEGAVQLAVDGLVSSVQPFESPVDRTEEHDVYQVSLQTKCIASEPAEGWQENYSLNTPTGIRYDTHWRVDAEIVEGAINGELAAIQQGVRVKDMVARCN